MNKTDCCTRWKKLPESDKQEWAWQVAHQLHHNVKTRGVPFTLKFFTIAARVDMMTARHILKECVERNWFDVRYDNPVIYCSPTKD